MTHVNSIDDWLEGLELAKCAPVFAEHQITFEMLPDLTQPDIDRLALPIGSRRGLIITIQALADELRAQRSLPESQSITRVAPPNPLFCCFVGTEWEERGPAVSVGETIRA